MAFTLAAPCEYREEIRKSRFLALAAPADSPQAAQAFIAAHSDRAASHNCWAWKCGAQYRFSDDGEPGGTAGRPILAAIEGQDCDNVVVLVIRWYGGIQLGTGGLARAYGGSAAKCLQGGERVALVARLQGHCHVPFAELARIRARIYRWYRYLRDIDRQLETGLPAARREAEAARLQRLERELAGVEVPLAYSGELYQLHLHLRHVLGRLQGEALRAPAAAPDRD